MGVVVVIQVVVSIVLGVSLCFVSLGLRSARERSAEYERIVIEQRGYLTKTLRKLEAAEARLAGQEKRLKEIREALGPEPKTWTVNTA